MADRSKIEWTDATPDILESLAAIDLSYMAGLIDGEGSISVLSHAKGKTVYPTMAVAMTDAPVIEWLGEKWGVAVSRMPRRAPGYRPQTFVRLSGARAILLCRLLLPYLRVKKRHAELLQGFPMNGRVGPGCRIAGTPIDSQRRVLRDQVNSLNFKPRNPAYRRAKEKS